MLGSRYRDLSMKIPTFGYKPLGCGWFCGDLFPSAGRCCAGMWLFLFHVIEKTPCEKHEASDDLVSCGNERNEVSLDFIGFKV